MAVISGDTLIQRALKAMGMPPGCRRVIIDIPVEDLVIVHWECVPEGQALAELLKAAEDAGQKIVMMTDFETTDAHRWLATHTESRKRVKAGQR